jgi:hypothetical protein
MPRRLLSLVGAVALSACQTPESPTPVSTITPPPPANVPAVTQIRSFSLTATSGSIRGSGLGWALDLDLSQPVQGLFVRVDLEFGPANLTNACYASEVSHASPFAAQAGLRLAATGFVQAERLWPGYACDWRQFQPTVAAVRVFGAADPNRLTPIAFGSYPVRIVVTN